MRYPMPSTASGTALLIAARTCSSFGRTASGCAAMYLSTDLGTLFFIPLILWFRIRFRSPITVWPSGSSGDPFHTASVLPFIELCRMQRWGLTWTCSRLCAEVPAGVNSRDTGVEEIAGQHPVAWPRFPQNFGPPPIRTFGEQRSVRTLDEVSELTMSATPTFALLVRVI